jgi:ribosomal protein L7/L12
MAAAAPGASTGAADSCKSNNAVKAPEVEVKTEFNVTLAKFDPASKAKIIREIKAILPGLNLVEAKAFVEGAPKLIKEKVKKEEAEKLKASLEALGATISLE